MDKFENKKIAVIGGGHIGLAFIEGLLRSGKISGSQLIVANPTLEKIAYLQKFNVSLTNDNNQATKIADWIVLAVKPSVTRQVLEELGKVTNRKLIISLVATIKLDTLREYAKSNNQQIVRIMPNLPIATNQGVIGLFTDKEVPRQTKQETKKLLALLGLVIEVDKEEELNIMTLISACGPALVTNAMLMLQRYGEKVGLSQELSRQLVLQTFRGTASYLDDSKMQFNQLVHSVATKGGITEAILTRLEENNFTDIFTNAMDDGYDKIRELSQKLNRDEEVIKNGDIR